MRQVRKKREMRCFYVRANDCIINRKYKKKWRFEVKMEHEKIIQFLIGQTESSMSGLIDGFRR